MKCTIFDIDLRGSEVLLEFLQRPDGIRNWNHWVQVIEPLVTQTAGSISGAIVMGLDFSSSCLVEMDLDGIDLGIAWLADSDLRKTSLRGARIGCPVRSIFDGADMTDAVICGDITGTDFRGAKLDGLRLDCCGFDKSSPPLGLPSGLASQCREDDPQPIRASTRLYVAPVQARARILLPAPCAAC